MFGSDSVTRCKECGEALYDGDTAYRLGERYYCTSCVDDALTVVRCGEDEDYFSEGE